MWWIYTESSVDSQIGEIPIGVASGPKGHFAANPSKFQIVDDEAGLLGSVDVKLCLDARHDDANPGPYPWLNIGIGFVKRRRLGSGAFEWIIGHGDVLKGMVAPHLIDGAG